MYKQPLNCGKPTSWSVLLLFLMLFLLVAFFGSQAKEYFLTFDNLITIGRLSVTSQSYEHTMEAEKVMFDQQLIKPRCIPKHRNKNIQKLSYD